MSSWGARIRGRGRGRGVVRSGGGGGGGHPSSIPTDRDVMASRGRGRGGNVNLPPCMTRQQQQQGGVGGGVMGSRGRGRGGNVNLPAWMTQRQDGDGSVGGSSGETGSTVGGNEPLLGRSRGRGRGRGRGSSEMNLPAWLTALDRDAAAVVAADEELQQQQQQRKKQSIESTIRGGEEERAVMVVTRERDHDEETRRGRISSSSRQHQRTDHDGDDRRGTTRDSSSSSKKSTSERMSVASSRRDELSTKDRINKHSTNSSSRSGSTATSSSKNKDHQNDKVTYQQQQHEKDFKEEEEQERLRLQRLAEEALNDEGEFEDEEEREARLARERRAKRRKLLQEVLEEEKKQENSTTTAASESNHGDDVSNAKKGSNHVLERQATEKNGNMILKEETFNKEERMDVGEKPRNPLGIILSEQEHSSETVHVKSGVTSVTTKSSMGGSGTDSFDMFASTSPTTAGAATATATSVSTTTTRGRTASLPNINKSKTSATKNDTALVAAATAKGKDSAANDAGNYDDAEGYYNATIGEIITFTPYARSPLSFGGDEEHHNGPKVAFRVLGIIGKGVFSTVLKCALLNTDTATKMDGLDPQQMEQQQQQPPTVVAMKLIRNNETMAKAALKEIRILRLLSSSSTSSNKRKKSRTSTDSNGGSAMTGEKPSGGSSGGGGGGGANNSQDQTTPDSLGVHHDNDHNIVQLLEFHHHNDYTEQEERDVARYHHQYHQLPTLEYRHHTALIFDYYPFNLRETLSKFGKGVGINLQAVRSYSKQLLTALVHLARHGIVHADIKPDNILVSSNFSCVKLCDFGSAFFESDHDNDPTPYLVSRFYRPPEVILGLTYDRAVDLWSVSVTLIELFTGEVAFPGRTNNDMLRGFMDAMGPFSNRMIRRHVGSFGKLGLAPHFESVPGGSYNFLRQELDRVTGRPVVRGVSVTSPVPQRQLVQVLLRARSKSDDRGDLLKFGDLLNRCLALDPSRRLAVGDALRHEFFVRKKRTVATDGDAI